MKRPSVLVLVLFALVLASCGKSVLARPGEPPLAARVAGTEITQDELLAEADLLIELSAGNPQLNLPSTSGEGTYSTELLAGLLTDQIQRVALVHVAAAEGVEVTDADREQARQFLQSAPPEYTDRFLDITALSVALANSLAEPVEVSDEDVEAFYNENADSLAQSCVSHILVSTDERSADEAEAIADDLKAQLDAGADFAELATDNSDDPGSAANGGDLGCAPQGSYVDEFDRAVWNQPVGEVGIPVQTDFGFHLILVTDRKVTLDDLRDDLRAGLEQQAAQDQSSQVQSDLQGLVLAYLNDVDVEVDARYGTWDPVTATVVPPEGPVPLPTTTVPGTLGIPSGALPSDAAPATVPPDTLPADAG